MAVAGQGQKVKGQVHTTVSACCCGRCVAAADVGLHVVRLLRFLVICVGAQLTLRGRHFARKCMYEKLIKCAAKFTLCILKRKMRVLKFKTTGGYRWRTVNIYHF